MVAYMKSAMPYRGVARPEVRRIARTGAWWDHTDGQAHRVTETLDEHPSVAESMPRWSTDESFWVRRLATIGQLGRRDRTDRLLLAEVIEPNLADSEFFIRKAIGWALRDFARHDPDWVRAYPDSHPLSSLSRREALKHV